MFSGIKGHLLIWCHSSKLLLNLRLKEGNSEGGTFHSPLNVLLPQVPCDRNSEIEELRSVIENLRENQQQLQKDKAEEVEQLHEVIERLQRELSLGGPAPLGAQVSELPGDPVASPEALVATGPAGRLLSEQERRHGQALEALQRRLQAAEEAAARKLAELEHSAALREAEVQGMASQIRAFEAALKAKEVKIAERDLEIDALKQQKLAHSAELETILSAFSRFRRSLEQQPLTAEDEPPELQRLRAQCVRLSRQLQVLNQRFLRCQKELDKQQARGAHLHPRAEGSSQGRGPGGEEASDDKASGQDVGTAPNSRVGDPQVGLVPSWSAEGTASVHRELGLGCAGGAGTRWYSGALGEWGPTRGYRGMLAGGGAHVGEPGSTRRLQEALTQTTEHCG